MLERRFNEMEMTYITTRIYEDTEKGAKYLRKFAFKRYTTIKIKSIST